MRTHSHIGMTDTTLPFDRATVRRNRRRAATGLGGHDFLFAEMADRLADRLEDVQRRFPVALDLGCHAGSFGRTVGARGGIETLVQCDLEPAQVSRAAGFRVAGDEERLPFKDGTFDLIASTLSLHWVNDLPGALVQVNRALKPDGLFLAALLGGETLQELRDCLSTAEIEIRDGLSPRISPTVDLRDAAGLLQRAGFALPVADSDRITVSYPDVFALMHELRGMGETNALAERPRGFTRRSIFLRAAELYQQRYAAADGRITATFQVLFLHGWAPHESQQQPLRPGSAATRLSDALATDEHSAGDKARPE